MLYPTGANMNKNILILAVIIGLFGITASACSGQKSGVINTNNALYVKQAFKLNEKSTKPEMKGRVIKLGTTDNSDFGPSFEFHKLRTN